MNIHVQMIPLLHSKCSVQVDWATNLQVFQINHISLLLLVTSKQNGTCSSIHCINNVINIHQSLRRGLNNDKLVVAEQMSSLVEKLDVFHVLCDHG